MVFPIVLASLWSAIAAELVVESARSGGSALVFMGRLLVAPTRTETVVILCIVSASAALAMATAVSYVRGRRLEQRMAEELADRWAELAEREIAEKARRELLSWRIGELHSLVDELLADRRGDTARHLVIVPDPPETGPALVTPMTTPSRSRP